MHLINRKNLWGHSEFRWSTALRTSKSPKVESCESIFSCWRFSKMKSSPADSTPSSTWNAVWVHSFLIVYGSSRSIWGCKGIFLQMVQLSLNDRLYLLPHAICHQLFDCPVSNLLTGQCCQCTAAGLCLFLKVQRNRSCKTRMLFCSSLISKRILKYTWPHFLALIATLLWIGV